MNTLMIPIILTAAFLLVGCEGTDDPTPDDITPPPEPNDNEGPFTAEFADGVLTYSATVMVPTPCHEVRVEENILESDPVQVAINVAFINPDPDVVCAQVVTEQTISGSITLGEAPGRVTLTTPLESYEAQV